MKNIYGKSISKNITAVYFTIFLFYIVLYIELMSTYVPTPISRFETHAYTAAWTSGTSVTVNVSRLNNVCTLIISGGMYAVGATTYKINTALPLRFRPSRNVCFPIIVEANTSNQYAYAYISTSGEIFAPVSTGNLSSNNLVGPNAGTGTFWTIDFPSVSYVPA
jgi:hypothetical protein